MVVPIVAVQPAAAQVPIFAFGIPVLPALLLGWNEVLAVAVVDVAADVVLVAAPKLEASEAVAPVPVSDQTIERPAWAEPAVTVALTV
jgi:hypothetical protein